MTTVKIARILVAGDCLNEWNLAHADGPLSENRAADIHCTPGESAHLARLLEEMARDPGDNPFEILSADPGVVSENAGHLASYQLLAKVKGKRDKNSVWRISEHLGYSADPSNPETRIKQPQNRTTGTADVIVIDDANLGFRNNQDAWPAQLQDIDKPGWIVHRLTRPVINGPLWKNLGTKRERLVAVLDIDDLRTAGVLISRGISWERTCEELAWEIAYSPDIGELAQCAFVVVNFPYCGAFLYTNHSTSPKKDAVFEVGLNLIFDPLCQEGQWEQGRPGNTLTATAALTATIARELARNPKTPDLKRGIKAGLAAMRKAHELGFVQTSDEARLKLSVPYEQIAAVEGTADSPFWSASIPAPWDEDFEKDWTLLEINCTDDLGDSARAIVRGGLDKGLTGVPVLSFGFLQTVDRSEIEGYNAINNIIGNYIDGAASKPLSIAVFGPPGAGKSFGIKQISKSIGGDSIRVVEFNLSQFNSPDDLISAFHVVRDIGLSGKIPLVFWDEFDSALGPDKQLFWLKYFLMPMQDGEFREGDLTHPIGRSIFIFAGGTKSTFLDFCAHQDISDTDFKNYKGPDFVSRLIGHINVLGPNPKGGNKSADRFYVVRRSILLRSMITRNSKGIVCGGAVNIDDGILSAFLETETFKHGARSMESIISMSLLEGKDKYERSSLPTADQMSAHVDPESFMDIVQQQVLNDEILDRMAAAVHEKVYPKSSTGTLRDLTFEQLPDAYKNSCREFVKSINDTLRRVGCVLVPRRGKVEPLTIPPDLLQELSEREHQRWHEERRTAGWRKGYPKQDPPECVSPYLVPWDELPERMRIYDRSFIVDIPVVLAPSGYTIRNTTAQHGAQGAESTPGRELRVGVTGHRKLEHAAALEHQIADAIKSLWNRGDYISIEVVSPLAEGADRLVAQVVVEQIGGTLRVPLPLAVKEYEKDFTDTASKTAFDKLLDRARQQFVLPEIVPPKQMEGAAPAELRALAYRQAGEFVLDDCDVLIALWNGKDSSRVGGTHEIVTNARGRGLPLICINTNDPSVVEEERLSKLLEVS